MSAQRKLISILAHIPRQALAPRSSIIPLPRSASSSRSIVTTHPLFRPAPTSAHGTGAKHASESTKEENKTVPSEQLTEEAKKAEPDAAEQVEEMEKKGLDPLPTQT